MGFVKDVYNRGKRSALCVGLDTSYETLPDCMKYQISESGNHVETLVGFNQKKIDVTRVRAAAYKLNLVNYLGSSHEALWQTVGHVANGRPYIPTILDAKFANPAHTNKKSAEWAFDALGVDAVTVMPNPGEEGLKPFLERSQTDGTGVLVVCRMSQGAEQFQDDIVPLNLPAHLRKNIPPDVWGILQDQALQVPWYAKVALTVAWGWNIQYGGNCGLVVGCTDDASAAHLKFVRSLVGDLLILVPGFGAQGVGTLEAQAARITQAGRTSTGDGILVNAGRSIYPYGMGENWLQDVERSAIMHNDALNIARMQDIPIPADVERPEFLRTRARRQPSEEPFIT